MTFHESRSVCYGFSQISERLPGLILKRGAKSQMLRASEIFWERLWNVWYQKNAQKISNIQTLPFPKPAHLQWAQDQGGWINVFPIDKPSLHLKREVFFVLAALVPRR